MIPVWEVMSRLHPVDPVISIPEDSNTLKSLDICLLNFGNSPVTEVWKTRLCQKLAERVNAFSVHKWDVGLAQNDHHIMINTLD